MVSNPSIRVGPKYKADLSGYGSIPKWNRPVQTLGPLRYLHKKARSSKNKRTDVSTLGKSGHTLKMLVFVWHGA